MKFDFTETDRLFRDSARKTFAKVVMPLVAKADADEKFPVELFSRLGELGYFGIQYPEDVGGAGGDNVTQCIWIEELAKVDVGIAGALMVQSGLATSLLHRHGSPEQVERYLKPALLGKKIGSFALTEPDSGSEALGMRTRAVRDGDDWVISGSKMFITNAPIADFFQIVCYTDRPARAKGVTIFVVDRDTPGLAVSKLHKFGQRSADTGEVQLNEIRVPASAVVGEVGKGWDYVVETLEHGRVHHAARSLGLARAAYEVSAAYAKQRIQFGKPIAEHQAIRFKLARMAVEIESAALHVYRTARLLDRGEAALMEASMAKLVASEAAVNATAEGMQIHGGYGYMMDYPIQRFYRDARLTLVTEGTSEIQHIVIARELGL